MKPLKIESATQAGGKRALILQRINGWPNVQVWRATLDANTVARQAFRGISGNRAYGVVNAWSYVFLALTHRHVLLSLDASCPSMQHLNAPYSFHATTRLTSAWKQDSVITNIYTLFGEFSITVTMTILHWSIDPLLKWPNFLQMIFWCTY